MSKIWANSGDSHLVEPDDLFESSLPAALAARMPHSVCDDDGVHETIHVDGESFRRRRPQVTGLTDENGMTVTERAPNANDPVKRLDDLDQEGIWAEVVYPSIGIWTASIKSPELLAAGARAINDWAIIYQESSPRYVCTATIPLLVAEDAATEIRRSAELGYRAAFFSVSPPAEEDWNYPSWDPVWQALDDTEVGHRAVPGDPHEVVLRSGQVTGRRADAVEEAVGRPVGDGVDEAILLSERRPGREVRGRLQQAEALLDVHPRRAGEPIASSAWRCRRCSRKRRTGTRSTWPWRQSPE